MGTEVFTSDTTRMTDLAIMSSSSVRMTRTATGAASVEMSAAFFALRPRCSLMPKNSRPAQMRSRMTQAERLDQRDLARKVTGVTRRDAAQLGEELRSDPFGFGVLHVVDHAMADGADIVEARLGRQPIRSILPDNTERGDSPTSNTAKRMLDEPPLMAKTQGMLDGDFIGFPLCHQGLQSRR